MYETFDEWIISINDEWKYDDDIWWMNDLFANDLQLHIEAIKKEIL